MATAKCQHLLENMSAYLDGEASAELCAEIERHLEGCADCRVVVDTLRKTVALYHELPQPELPPEARLRLYKSLDLSEFLNLTPVPSPENKRHSQEKGDKHVAS